MDNKMKKSTRNIGAKTALFSAAIIWGSSFLIVKDSMDYMQPHFLIAARFTIASLLLSLIFFKRLKNLNKDYFIGGAVIGLFLFLGYTLQTIGITDTTPGKNAFLTAVYCVIVPFLFWAVDKKKPDVFHIMAAFTTIIGIGFVSLNGDFTIRMGDTLTLLGGVAYAAHLVSIAKFGKDKDPVLFTILQFAFSSVLSWVIVICFHEVPTKMDGTSIISLLYLAVFASAFAMLFQNVGQKYTKPAPASIILSLESVFGVLFSVVFYHETLTMKLIFGFFLIFIAVIISETKLSFLFRNEKEILQDNEIKAP